jgi:phosphoribosylglycinamide formyltransferase-1
VSETASTRPPLRVSVLVSGEGTTAVALAEAFRRGEADAEITLVVADRPGIPALERAGAAGLTTWVAPSKGTLEAEWARQLNERLQASQVDLVVLAGFLRRLPDEFLAGWSGRIVNVHPSLLPRHGGVGMYGERVHAAVLAQGDRETGATVHEVTSVVDGGPVLWQERVAVGEARTPAELRELVRPLEVRGLLSVIRQAADERRAVPD